jgi:hypothetical protein
MRVVFGVVGLALVFHGAMTASCTSSAAFVATAEALKVTSDEFVATAALMDSALADKTVTPEQYRRWAVFAKRFQALYNLAVDLWEAAIKVDDKISADKAAQIIAQLAATLAEFYTSVSKAIASDGGGP